MVVFQHLAGALSLSHSSLSQSGSRRHGDGVSAEPHCCQAGDLQAYCRDEAGGCFMLMSSLGKVGTPQDHSRDRCALLNRLFEITAEIFPNIELRIQEANPSFHAQAFVLGGRRIVTLLGGLAFNGRLQKDGLLFAILHEIGHHVAPGPRITPTDPLCCDCAADRWAIAEGRRLFSSRGMTLDIRSALNEIESALSALTPAYDLESERLCFDWARRKAALTSIAGPQVLECEFRKLCW
jgi:hypothetical protein